MQRVQESFGKQNVEVLLLSVDAGYGIDGERDRKLLESRKSTWPNVLLPGGWVDVMRTFNLSGYGIVVVDAVGNVRGVEVFSSQLVDLVATLWTEQSVMRAKSRAQQRDARSGQH